MNEIKPFFTYYGGKWRVAKKYPRPLHNTVIEPFCGSAGYSLRHYEKNVILYDLNEKIFGVWSYLIKVKESEINKLPLFFDDVRDLNIPIEAKWLIGFWLNKGHVQPCNKPSKWMRSGIRPNSMWGEVIRERISSQLKKIRHWKIFNESYEKAENQKATWFVDPPYHSKSGRLYPHNKINYEKLSDWCKALEGQVIVCEMEGAKWLPFKPFAEIKTTEGPRGKAKCNEIIWTKD